MEQEVWTLEDVYISVFTQDASGNVVEPAVRDEAFAQSVMVRVVRHRSEYLEPGNARQSRRTYILGYEIEVQALACDEAEQRTPFLVNDSQQYMVRIHKDRPRAVAEEETWDFHDCTVSDGPQESHRADAVGEVNITFWAPDDPE